MANVTGSVVATTIQGSVGAATIQGTVSASTVISDALVGGIKIIDYDTPPYEGDYIITPELEAFVMPTNGLRMTDDVVVREIPVTYTSNLYDGITVLIG